MTDADPVEVALHVTDVFEELGVRYVVGGSLASSVFGEARATQDVDLVADLGTEHVEPLLARLGDAFYADQASIREAVERRASFNLIHLASLYKVDVFAAPDDALHAEKWRRRRRVVVLVEPRREAWVTDPECLVLQKLVWYRAGGGVSDRQWRDVSGVLKVQGEGLDLDYLVRMGAELGLEVLVSRALREAGLRP